MNNYLIHIGLVEFSEPTLLLVGDAAAFQWLADCIESRELLDFSKISSIKLVNVGLIICPVEGGSDLCQVAAEFILKVSPLESEQFASQLRALASKEGPAHAYLDCESNTSDVPMVASKDEYLADTVFAA